MTAPATLAPRAARPATMLLGGASLLALVGVAALLVPWDWLPGGEVVRVDPAELLTPAQLSAAEAYAGTQRRLGWLGLALSTVVAVVLGLTPLGARLVRGLRGWWWWRTLLATALVLLAGALAALPVRLAVWSNAVDAGLSTQTWAAWLRDWSVSLAVSTVVSGSVVLLVLATARLLPRRWPVAFGAAAAGLLVAGSWAYPVVVEPLFNDFAPLPEGQLRTEVLEVAAREDVPVADVLVADASRRTTRLNAYVSGLGSTRRVVLYDTLVEDVPREETLVVVAHELGHAKYQDVAVGTALAALGVGVGAAALGLLLGTGVGSRLSRRVSGGGPSRPEVVPLVLALVTLGTLAATPVESAVSRAMEARADRASLEATQDVGAFERMQVRLATRSLAEPDAPALQRWWFGTHPTLVQRVGLARGWAEVERER